jgi:hypothetical protein
MRRLSPIVALATALLLGACTGGSSASPSPPSTGGTRPSSTATLSIVSPANGSVVRGSTVDVRLSLSGAHIVKATSSVLRPDEGHVHLIVDGKLVSMNYSLNDTITGVSPGHHLLQAEFVANDHAPFDPRVIAVSSFEVKP